MFVHISSSIYDVQVQVLPTCTIKPLKEIVVDPKKKKCKASPFRGQKLSFVAMVDGAA